MRRAPALITLFALVAGCSEDVQPVNRVAPQYLPPAPTPSTPSAPILPRPTVSPQHPAAAVPRLTAVDFKVEPTLREGALRVLSAAQLDQLDAVYLGRLDLHAFVADGSFVRCWIDGAGNVAAADVMLKDGSRLRVGRHLGEPSGWYDYDGRSMRSEVLGRPVALSRVTSKFGQRLHPITGANRQHRGVDYGAPEGTPVFAVGDGVVGTAASSASAGNHIKIQHLSGHESWYLHLHHFAAGIRAGSAVKQGDVIGVVGTTGASTGPHLHYELHRSGIALDPHKMISSPERVLGPLTQPAHRRYLESLQ